MNAIEQALPEPSVLPFERMAADYDRQFTESVLGRLMRQAVWRRLAARFQPGDHILELNCGTGEDAIYLAQRGICVLATDIAPGMVHHAQEKVTNAGLSEKVEVRQLAIEQLADLRFERMPGSPTPCFDGALSNFGGLNCVADLGQVAQDLMVHLRPGAIVLLCLMGPMCPWEWFWYLRRGQPAKALRRLKRGGVSWRGLKVYYPSIRTVQQAFGPHFRLLRASAIGALLPPTYAEAWAIQHPRLIERLATWERRCETWPLLPGLADHYLLEFIRERG